MTTSIIKKANNIQVISVTGGKGGVGKSNISINLATSLAAQNKKVMLLDADLGLANVDVLLNLPTQKNISHVLNGEAKLQEIIIDGPKGIKIIPSASGLQQMTSLSLIQQNNIIHAFNDVVADLDTLIIDTAAGISDHVMMFSQASQEVIVVVCNEPTSITDAYALIKVMSRDYNVSRFRIVANMVNQYSEGKNLFLKLAAAADKFLDVTLMFEGIIPYDDLLRKSVQQQKAVTELYPSSRVSLAFKQLANKVNHWPINQKASGHIRFFLEQLIQGEQNLQGSAA